MRMRRLSNRPAWLFACLLLTLGGCATINFDTPKTESTAIAPDATTYLGKRIGGLDDEHPGQSGFYTLSDGVDALAARYVLAGRAERTIDLMYFVLKPDPAGSALIIALLDAADRGVRLRVLIDDAEIISYDQGASALAGHPNIEIRIWNPFARSVPVWLNAVTDFRRINRRMHNKAFIADNQIAVIGGRNLAAEYFAARPDVVFRDLDVACVGPIVQEVSAMFDLYWNHKLAVPVHMLTEAPEDPATALQAARQRITKRRDELADGPYAGVLNNAIVQTIATSEDDLFWAPYTLLYDSPDKGLKKRPQELEPLITPQLLEAADQVEKELIIITPYFVPRKPAMALFRELRERDVKLRVITNSLASTNQTLVQSGYAGTRKRLLGMGVLLNEINPTSNQLQQARDGITAGAGTLHAKVFIADRQRFFIGTFNFDPRSAYINTEMGVIINDPEMANEFATAVEASLPAMTYTVTMNDRGSLRWLDESGDEPVTYTREPETGFWKRFGVNFLRILPIKDQL